MKQIPFFRVDSLFACDGPVHVSGVSFRLDRGECLLLFVPDRDERCLLAHALMGTRPPGAGEVWLGRRRFTEELASARLGAGMGLVISRDCLYASLCDERDLSGSSFGYCRTPVFPARARWLGEGELPERVRRACVLLPGGDRPPRVLIVADPGLGDLGDRQTLTGALSRYREGGGTLVLLTGRPREQESLADQVGLIRQGRLVGLARREAGVTEALWSLGERPER